MIKSFFSFILQILFFFMVLNVSISSQTIVGKFGKYKITLDEFEYAYAKNVGGWVIAEKDSFKQYKDFLDLYLNFLMKLRNAYVRGFDTDPELKKELLDYEEQIGKAYIIEKYIIQPGIKSLYENRKIELRVSHIMVKPGKDGDEAAYEKANAILDTIKSGVSFEEMAEKYLDDKLSATTQKFAIFKSMVKKKLFLILFVDMRSKEIAFSILQKIGFSLVNFANLGNLKSTAA